MLLPRENLRSVLAWGNLRIGGLLAAPGLALLLGGCWMEPWQTVESPQVGFLYVGPVGDHGWTKAHDDGRIYLEEALPQVTTHYQPSVLAADALSVMEEFIADGDNIIITTSFDFLSATQSAAANYPGVSFLNCSGFVSSPNLGSYFGRMYQVWYLAGMVAAYVSTKGRIGVVGPVVIPETVRHLDALTLGAREVNPDIVVHVEWIDNWYDVDLEPEVTEDLIDAGADVIVSKTDTTIPLETVENLTTLLEPLYSIGYDNEDSCSLVGDSCLTSPYWNWGPLYARLVQQMIDGTWDPFDVVWDQVQASPEDSTVYLAEMTDAVPSSVRMEVEIVQARLADAENIHLPFVGPISDNTGVLRVADGDEMTDEELLRMCWYVDGVIDADGNPAEVPGGCGGDY